MGLAQKAMLVDLHLSKWSSSKVDPFASKKVTDEANAEAGSAVVSKRLIPKEAFADIITAWNALRNEFQRVLAQSATNMYDTGDALVNVANGYAATDDAAKQELQHQEQMYVSQQQLPIDDPAKRKQPIQPQEAA